MIITQLCSCIRAVAILLTLALTPSKISFIRGLGLAKEKFLSRLKGTRELREGEAGISVEGLRLPVRCLGRLSTGEGLSLSGSVLVV